jgi:AraC family transcriptional regulator
MALSSTINGERDSARECLDRAAEMLRQAETAAAGRRIRGGLVPWQVHTVIAHIDAHIDQPIKSRDLAAILRMDPCQFSRAFRNSFGHTPIEHLIRLRMERAQELMLSTDAPLSTIALECGLADQAHFSRLFRRTIGESPSAWRRARVTACASRLST